MTSQTSTNTSWAAGQMPPTLPIGSVPCPYGKRSYKPGLRWRRRGRFLMPEDVALIHTNTLGRC